MKVNTNKLFPYPVLSIYNDSYVDNEFLCDCDFEYDSVNAEFKLSYTINDQIVVQMIRENRFGLYFMIDSPETKYRELFPVTLDENLSFHIELPLSKLNGTIETVSLIISKEEINDCRNMNLNEAYDKENIFMPKNSMVGFTDTDTFYINKKIDSNGDIPSIFKICCDEDGSQVTYDAGNDEIYIYLPKEQYEMYTEYKGQNLRMKQLMVNYPVLVEVLDVIKGDGGNNYDDKPWYNALDGILVKKGYSKGLGSENFKNESSVKIAQDLLGDIYQDAFKEFDELKEDR